MSEPKHKYSTTRSEGSEVSGGPVRRDIHEVTYDDSSKHTTESVTRDSSSWRMSWDTDSSGNDSNFHSNKN